MASTRTVSTALSSSSVQSSFAGVVLTQGSLPGRGERAVLRASPRPSPRLPTPADRLRDASCPSVPEEVRDIRRPPSPGSLRVGLPSGDRPAALPRRDRGVRRADQAARHRAAAPDHGAGDVLRGRAASPTWVWCWRPSSAAPLSAGSASALNCVYDRDIDEQMRRTRRRALPRHIVTPASALVFGVVLAVLATVILYVWVNPLSAGLSLVAECFYLFVYTMLLKRRTTQNIVWGGLAGCFPALIGWTAVTDHLAWAPVVLFARRLLLDAAAHLGAGPALPRGLRGGRRADAAGGRPGRGGGPPDRRLQLGDGGDLAAAVAGGRHRLGLPADRRPRSARSSWCRPTGCGAGRAAPRTSA